MRVEYVLNGVPGTLTVAEGKEVRIPSAGDQPAGLAKVADVVGGEKGKFVLTAWKSGAYELTGADGRVRKAAVETLPAPLAVEGPWVVKFQPGRLALRRRGCGHMSLR